MPHAGLDAARRRRARGSLLAAAILALPSCSGSTAPRDVAAGERTIVLALDRDGNRDVYAVRADGTGLTRLTTDAADDGRPTGAGSTVVFVSARDGGSALYAVSIGGGAARRLTSSGVEALDPALSPDGRRLAYTSAAGGGAPRLTISEADGSGAAALPAAAGDPAAADASPAWRPDGRAIAWTTTAGGSAEIVMATIGSSGAPVTVAGGAAAEVEPAWRPDGGAIAFVSTRECDQAVFVVEIAGGAVRRVSPRGLAASSPTWLSASEIVYVAREGVAATLRRQPADGGGPAAIIPLPADATPSHARVVPTS